MTTLTVKVDQTVADEIVCEAKRRRVRKSDVIRERLVRGKPTGKVSMWDLIKDLVIDDDHSPRDLSTNKKHLAGYGKHRSHR